MSEQMLTVTEPQKGFMVINTLDQAVKVSELIAASNFCPKDMKGKPGDILVAMQLGAELGLQPMQAIQNIAVINGRPSVWGDAMLAICRQASDFEFIDEQWDEEKQAATCTVKRRNQPPVVRTFSMRDAKTAGLEGKDGPWRSYPKRMCQMRARGFALRDNYTDLLKGINLAEEARDIPPERVDYSSYKGGYTFDNKPSELVNEDHLEILNMKVQQSGANFTKFLEHMQVEKLEEMSVEKWKEACRMLDKKISTKRKTEEVDINKHFQEVLAQEQAREAVNE